MTQFDPNSSLPEFPQPEPRRPRPVPGNATGRRSFLLPMLLFGFLVLLFSMVLVVGFVLFRFKASSPVKVSSDSVLSLRVSGQIPEFDEPSPFNVLFNRRHAIFIDYLRMLDKAKNDENIKGIFLEVGLLSMGWAQIDELRQALLDFKSTGKWIVAHGEMWQEGELFLASAADEIFLVPESYLFWNGLMARSSYYRDLFDKYGVGVHVEAIGEYKSFADTYRYNEMSEPHREATSALLATLQNQLFAALVTARKLEHSAVEAAFEEAVYTGQRALDFGLIDGMKYRDETVAYLAQKLGMSAGAEPKLVEALRYIPPALNQPNRSFGGKSVAVIYGVGAIQSGRAAKGFFGDTVIASDSFIEDLKAARKDPNVGAIVLRIDSPGGSSLASDVIWREVRKTVEEGKPVIASMGNVAASGGYYIAMACDEIFAQPTTITGSIGVVAVRFDFRGLYEKLDINVDVVKTHPHADFFDPYRKLTDEEINGFHQRTMGFYNSFVGKAAQSRSLSFDELEAVARGRVWSGDDALKRKLVDHMGGLEDAIAAAAAKAGMTNYHLEVFPKQKDFFTLLSEQPLANSQAQQYAALVPKPVRVLLDLSLSLPQEQTVLALMPYQLEIK